MENQWVQIGVVGVDSGQLLLCDPCYINSQWQEEWVSNFDNPPAPFCYSACCKATLSSERYGQLNYDLGHAGVAVAFASGMGDGVYPVYARFDGGRIAEVKIVMLPHPVLDTK